MKFISAQIDKNFQHALRCFNEFETHPNDQQLLTLSCLLKLLHVGRDKEGFLDGCKQDIVTMLDSLLKNVHKRNSAFDNLWMNNNWVSLTTEYLGINCCECEYGSVSLFDLIDYEHCRVPYMERKEDWNIFSKGLLDVTFKNNNGDKILFNLLNSIRRGETISIGILYHHIDQAWGNDIGREIKDAFLAEVSRLSTEELKEVVFLPLKCETRVKDSYEEAMSILAMEK